MFKFQHILLGLIIITSLNIQYSVYADYCDMNCLECIDDKRCRKCEPDLGRVLDENKICVCEKGTKENARFVCESTAQEMNYLIITVCILGISLFIYYVLTAHKKNPLKFCDILRLMHHPIPGYGEQLQNKPNQNKLHPQLETHKSLNHHTFEGNQNFTTNNQLVINTDINAQHNDQNKIRFPNPDEENQQNKIQSDIELQPVEQLESSKVKKDQQDVESDLNLTQNIDKSSINLIQQQQQPQTSAKNLEQQQSIHSFENNNNNVGIIDDEDNEEENKPNNSDKDDDFDDNDDEEEEKENNNKKDGDDSFVSGFSDDDNMQKEEQDEDDFEDEFGENNGVQFNDFDDDDEEQNNDSRPQTSQKQIPNRSTTTANTNNKQVDNAGENSRPGSRQNDKSSTMRRKKKEVQQQQNNFV